ncbi:MAG: ribosome maturation factor RimP [Pseudomonadota bacterium]
MRLAATDRIRELIEPVIEDLGFELVRVAMMGKEKAILQIMAERPDGTMTVSGCETISREISTLLDIEDPIKGEYDLEVSSPGIDRPLTRPKDFARWAGFEAKLELRNGVDGRRRFKGTLLGIDDADDQRIEIRLRLDGDGGPQEDVRLPFDDVEKAKLVLTDALIALGRPQPGDQAETDQNAE